MAKSVKSTLLFSLSQGNLSPKMWGLKDLEQLVHSFSIICGFIVQSLNAPGFLYALCKLVMLTSDSTDEQSEDSFIFLEMDLVNVIQISTSHFYSLRNSLMAMSHLVKKKTTSMASTQLSMTKFDQTTAR